MNKKTIYLHIGMHKTGTTALQQFFYRNRAVLAAKGVFYPNVNDDIVNLRPLFPRKENGFFREVMPETKEMYRKYFGDMYLSQIKESDCQNILLSLEDMSSLDAFRGTLENFIDVLFEFGFDVKIIVYIRPIAEWIVSVWQETFKDYNTYDFYGDEMARIAKSIYTYPALIEKIGKENVIMKAFERAQFKNQDLIEDFLDIFAMDLSDEFDLSAGDINIGFGRNHLELFKIINSLGNKEDIIFRNKIIEQAPKEDISVIETLSDEQILELTNNHKDIHTQLANIYGKDRFFVNDFPKCYGKERPEYDKATFNKEQMELLFEALKCNKEEKNKYKKALGSTGKEELVSKISILEKENASLQAQISIKELNFLEKIFFVGNRINSKGEKRKTIRILGFRIF